MIIVIISVIVTKLLESINFVVGILWGTNETMAINYNLLNLYFAEIKHQTNKLTKDCGYSIMQI